MAGKGKSLSEQSSEQLASTQKAMTGVLAVIGVLLLVYVGYYVHLFVTGRFDSERHLIGMIPGLMLIPISAPLLVVRSKVREELAKRR